MDWNKKVQKNILPLSAEQDDLKVALQEWLFTELVMDHIDASETCQLCDNSGLRYHFEIINRENDNKLLVGSSCIERFDIAVFDENGELLKGKERKKKLNARIREYKQESVLKALRTLWKLDKENQTYIEECGNQFKEKGKLSPKQFSFVSKRLADRHIEFEESYIDITVGSRAHKLELFNLAEDDRERILASLSKKQLISYRRWEIQHTQEEKLRLQREAQHKAELEKIANRPRRINREFDLPPQRYRTPQQLQPIAECLICGNFTSDWWFYDGANGTCKCNSCKNAKD